MDARAPQHSHTETHEDHAARAKLVRDVQEEIGRPLALIGDLQGPKFRVGGLDQPLDLPQGERSHCRHRRKTGARNGELPIAPAAIGEVLAPGPRGLDRRRNDPAARRRGEGRPRPLRHRRRRDVTSHKGVNLPGVPIPIPSLTRKDLEDLAVRARARL